MVEAGAGVLLHAFVQDVAVHDGRRRRSSWPRRPPADRGTHLRDASGDADLCHFAGFGYELAGELEPAQTLTTMFRVANVDLGNGAAAVEGGTERVDGRGLEQRRLRHAAPGEGSDHITPVEGMTATIMTCQESFRRDGDRVVNATDPDFLIRG